MRTTKIWKRMASTALACLLSVGSVAAVPTVYAEDGATAPTYAGATVTQHTGGYDYGFMNRNLVTHGYDFSLDRINHYVWTMSPAL